jgi:hypothetical protein
MTDGAPSISQCNEENLSPMILVVPRTISGPPDSEATSKSRPADLHRARTPQLCDQKGAHKSYSEPDH